MQEGYEFLNEPTQAQYDAMRNHSEKPNSSPAQYSDEELRKHLACIMGGCIGSHKDCLYETIPEHIDVDSPEETAFMVDMQMQLIKTYGLQQRIEALDSLPKSGVIIKGKRFEYTSYEVIEGRIADLTNQLERKE